MVQNKALIFLGYPSTKPVVGEHIQVKDIGFDTNQSTPTGGAIVKINYVSFDPYQRGRMRKPVTKSYVAAFILNNPITNVAIGTVLKSDNSKFKEGDVLVGMMETAEYTALDKETADRAQVLYNKYNLDPKTFLGALGMSGLTAYSSFYEIGQPKKGETIFISAASGAVGHIVGQLAKHEGLTVIGSVGDDKKLEFIQKELGFDGGFNYKKEKPLDALRRLAPHGIDIYYENVGGEQLQAAITHMNERGRIVACGMISQYNLSPDQLFGVNNTILFARKRLKMQGFIVSDADMGPKYTEEHQKNMQKWIHDGSFKAGMSVTEGIDNAAEGLLGLFEGTNFGKAVLEVAKL